MTVNLQKGLKNLMINQDFILIIFIGVYKIMIPNIFGI